MFSTSERTYWWTTSFERTNGGEGEWNKFRPFYNETLDHLIDLVRICSVVFVQTSKAVLIFVVELFCNCLVCVDSLVVKDGLKRHPPDWNRIALLSPGDKLGQFFYFCFVCIFDDHL